MQTRRGPVVSRALLVSTFVALTEVVGSARAQPADAVAAADVPTAAPSDEPSRDVDVAEEPEIEATSPVVDEGDSGDDLFDLSLEQLMQIRLGAGSFLDLDPRTSPQTLTVITRDEIAVSGARHLSEVLEIFVPGFQYMINKWNGIVWGFRGVAPDRNTKLIVLVNGYRVNFESTHGIYADLELGLLGDVERIEVLHGPSSLTLGPGSIAGAVNIVTRTPNRTMGEVRIGATTTRDYRAEAFTNLSLGPDESLSLAVGLRRARGFGLRNARVYGNNEWPTDGVPSPDGEPTDGSAWSTPGNAMASLDWRRDRLRVYARYSRQQISTGQYFIVDPYPEYSGAIPPDAGPRFVDGRAVYPTDPLAQTESGGLNRRLHLVDAVHVQATYEVPFDVDRLTLELAAAGVTDRMSVEERAGYDVPGASPRSGSVVWSFGERRYTASLRYLMQRVEHLQLAVGGQYRIDDIGDDLAGRNYFNGVTAHYFIHPVRYHSSALFAEAMWTPRESVAVEAGVRADYHTRGGFMPNPRASVSLMPNDDHLLRLLAQTSTNTGQADYYEYNNANVDDTGRVLTGWNLTDERDPNSSTYRRSTLAEMRSLSPERAISVELSGIHSFADVLTIRHATSITRVTNLFSWNTALFREVNAGAYSFLTVELAANVDFRGNLRGGINHVYTAVLAADRTPIHGTYPGPSVVDDGDGTYSVVDDPANPRSFDLSPVTDSITTDGRRFLNLTSNITKFQLTYAPLEWLTLHTNVRMFWGLRGRAGLWASDIAAGDDYLGLERNRGVIVKWNLSVHFALGRRTSLAVFAYDLLGSARNRHSVRWQQTANPVQRELYTVDQRMFAFSLQQDF